MDSACFLFEARQDTASLRRKLSSKTLRDPRWKTNFTLVAIADGGSIGGPRARGNPFRQAG
jgi:hypothetical protein